MKTAITFKITEPVGVGFGNLEAPEMELSEAQGVCETVVKKYLVEVESETPGCCIDGRCCSKHLDGSDTKPGPKVAGGPLITAYAAAKLTGWFEPGLSQEEELVQLAAQLEAEGIVLGGHCDAAAKAGDFAGNTGCGADDKLLEIIKNIGREDIRDGVIASVKLALNSDDLFDESVIHSIVAAAANAPVTSWDPTAMITALGDTKTEVLEGAHEEVIVLLNYQENTTVDRDALVQAEGKQVFVVDAWYIAKIAQAMARGPEPTKQFAELVHAAVAYQVGTLLTLGNGTHRLAQLIPQ